MDGANLGNDRQIYKYGIHLHWCERSHESLFEVDNIILLKTESDS